MQNAGSFIYATARIIGFMIGMSEFRTILVEKKRNVAKITFNRPDALNAMSREMLSELKYALDELRVDEQIRAIILTGAGERAFSAGADLKGGIFSPDTAPLEALELSRLGQEVANIVESYEKPIIAAVNGFALGGGSELAMACDIIVASKSAQFGQPEINLGFLPAWGGTQRLPRLVGKLKAKELVFTGERITADEAERLGLVNKVVPPEDLEETAFAFANKLAGKAPVALKLAKSAINRSGDTDLQTGLAYEAEAMGLCFATDDAKEGLKAFLEKRQPTFRGR